MPPQAVNSFLIGYLWNKDIREHDQQKYRLLYAIPIQRRRLPNCYPSCVHSRELWAIELSHHLDEQGLYTASVILFHDRRHLRRLHAEWNIMKHHDMAQVAAQIQSPSCGTNYDTFTLGPRDLLVEFGHVEECRCPATQRDLELTRIHGKIKPVNLLPNSCNDYKNIYIILYHYYDYYYLLLLYNSSNILCKYTSFVNSLLLPPCGYGNNLNQNYCRTIRLKVWVPACIK